MQPDGSLHCRVWVSGTVQGVWFRQGTKETADRLRILGHVENLPDGRVLIEAEGSRADMDAFISWCHKGPPRAVVSSVVVEEGDLQDFPDFVIRR